MRLLVATDGSDVSIEAARRALTLVRPPDSVVVLTVASPPPVAVATPAVGIEGAPVPMAPADTPEVEEALEDDAVVAADRTAEALGVPAERRVARSGDPGAEICRVAAEGGFDLVVLGSHGHGVVHRVLTGSVSDHVVRHAPCPVLVVRARR